MDNQVSGQNSNSTSVDPIPQNDPNNTSIGNSLANDSSKTTDFIDRKEYEDLKSKYSNSSTEAKRLKDELDRITLEKEGLAKYAEAGFGWEQKYSSDPTFRELIDGYIGGDIKKTDMSSSDKKIMSNLSDEDQSLLEELRADRQKKQFEEKQLNEIRYAQMQSLERELGLSDEINKFNKNVLGNDGKVGVHNPVRTVAEGHKDILLQRNPDMDEKEAYRIGLTLALNPESLKDEAFWDGMVEGAESARSKSFYGASRGGDGNVSSLTREDKAVIESFGSKIDPKVYEEIKRRQSN